MERENWQESIADPARFVALRADYDRDGYLIFPSVLSAEKVAELSAALTPHLEQNLAGRNDFEGLKTSQRYSNRTSPPKRPERG